MRPVLPLVIIAALAGCAKEAPPPAPPPAPVANIEETVPDARFCARAPEKTALEVAGLKSRLMVAALSCNVTDKYNDFILKNRPVLVQQEKAMGSYFGRNYGKRGQAEQDDYITALANMQSQRRLRDSARFCEEAQTLFTEVGAMRGPSDLPPLASVKKISQPMNLTECPAEPAPTPKAAAKPARRSSKR
ncbi:MAG TPA: hypothetical protein VGC80_01955 [Acetobacteraceae bacterium]